MLVLHRLAFGCLIASWLWLYGASYILVLGGALVVFLTLSLWKIIVWAIKICQVIPRDLRYATCVKVSHGQTAIFSVTALID